MTWGGLNPALTSWRNGINDRFPDRDTTTDGARADKLHGSTSQHQADKDGTVDAFDNDVNYLRSNTATGSPAERRIVEALKLDFEADGRGQLWIHDREIANRDIGHWRERDYEGDSPHDHHVHWQSRQATERDGSPWAFRHTDALLREMRGDMTPTEVKAAMKEALTEFFAVSVNGSAATGTQTSRIGKNALDQGVPNPIRGGKTEAWRLLADIAAAVKPEPEPAEPPVAA